MSDERLPPDGMDRESLAPTRAGGAAVVFEERYELGELIGSGGMGRVYRAWDRTLHRAVAIKMLGPALAADEPARQRFLREARAAAALDHPNIGAVHDFGAAAGGEAHIVMAYYRGESLRERLERGALPVAEALRIVAAVADGLACAHRAGVVHRDVKPSNVLLTEDGQVKLIDFGVAWNAGSPTLTVAGQLVGTPSYMAPEQISGGVADARSDIWSLGVVLYEMLAGRRPFDGTDAQAVLGAVLHGEAPPLELPAEPAAGSVRTVLARALAKRPGERYASAEDLRAELARICGAPTATAMPQGRALAKRRRRRRWALVMTAGAALTAAVAGYLKWPPPASALSAPVVAVLPFDNLTGNHDLNYLGRSLSTDLTWQLADLPELTVVGSSRVQAVSAEEHDPAAIGERLSANAIVEGQLRGSHDRLRVMVSLLDPHSGQILWTWGQEGSILELNRLERDLLAALAPVLAVPLSRHERRRLQTERSAARAFTYYLRGLNHLDRPGDVTEPALAADLFRQAVAIEPRSALFHAGLAEALWQLRSAGGRTAELDEIEEHARAALALEPRSTVARMALAKAMRARGRASESIAELEPLLAEHPKPDEAYRELGYGYESAGDLRTAEACLRKAVAIAPANWYNWNTLGTFLAEQWRFDDARAALDRAVAIAPEGVVWPLLNRGAVRVGLNDFSGAIADFEATEATTSDPSLASNLATAYFYSGYLEKAEQLYSLAVELDPEDPVLHRNLGDALNALGRKEQATSAFREALRLTDQQLRADDNDPSLLSARVLYAAKAGDCKEAVRQAREVAPELPASCKSHLYLTIAFTLCDARTEALAEVKRSLEDGCGAGYVAAQPELQPLVDDPDFVRLTRTAGDR